MKSVLNKILPFITLGIAIAAFAFGLVLLAYLFFFGAVIGLILYIVDWVKHHYASNKKMPTKHRQGRTFDSDDWHVH